MKVLEGATRELEASGYKLLVKASTEPWGQVVSRMLSPEGMLVGVTMTPWMRNSPFPRVGEGRGGG